MLLISTNFVSFKDKENALRWYPRFQVEREFGFIVQGTRFNHHSWNARYLESITDGHNNYLVVELTRGDILMHFHKNFKSLIEF